jgi:hypothetical protein
MAEPPLILRDLLARVELCACAPHVTSVKLSRHARRISRPPARLTGGEMSLQTRLDALKERHASLESRILDEDQRPRPDSEILTRLKIEKLRVKEEIERLREHGAFV